MTLLPLTPAGPPQPGVLRDSARPAAVVLVQASLTHPPVASEFLPRGKRELQDIMQKVAVFPNLQEVH